MSNTRKEGFIKKKINRKWSTHFLTPYKKLK